MVADTVPIEGPTYFMTKRLQIGDPRQRRVQRRPATGLATTPTTTMIHRALRKVGRYAGNDHLTSHQRSRSVGSLAEHQFRAIQCYR